MTDLEMTPRETGITMQQMQQAPIGAIFVWCNGDIGYPRALARRIGREDLVIKPSSWLQYRNLCGVRPSGLVIDHASRLTDDQLTAVNIARQKGVPEVQP